MKQLVEILDKNKYKNKIQDYQDTTSFDKSKNQWCSRKFILDTGASNSCIGFESIELFRFKLKILKQWLLEQVLGMRTQIATNNLLR
jgi:hypothetical protein